MDERQHIVVVEDEATQRDLLVDYLARQNFRVDGVAGGAALRRLVERELPALVMLDVGCRARTGSPWRAGCARRAVASASSW
jgi:DNA-binding response OmpR family regulator